MHTNARIHNWISGHTVFAKKNMNDKSNNCVVCYTIAAVAVTTKLTCDNAVTRKIHTENLEQQQ